MRGLVEKSAGSFFSFTRSLERSGILSDIEYALNIIKRECASRVRCDDCPLCTDFGECYIADKNYWPEDWDLESLFRKG